MPVKKIAEVISAQDMKELTSKLGAKKSEKSFLTSLLIFLVIFMYICLVSYRVYNGMEDQFSVSEEESKKCLVDFQKKNCNALRLDGGECSQLYSCVQKQKEAGVVLKSWSLVTISVNEIKESAMFPAVIVLMLLVYQIERNLKRR